MALCFGTRMNSGQGATIRFGTCITRRISGIARGAMPVLLAVAAVAAFLPHTALAIEPPTWSRDVQPRQANLEKRARQLLDGAARRWMQIGDMAADADLDRAIFAYRNARRMAPRDFWTAMELMRLLRLNGDIRRAARVSRIAIRNATDDWHLSVALTHSGQLAQELGKHADAREKLDRVVALRTALLAASRHSPVALDRDEAALDLAEAHSNVCSAELDGRAFARAIASCRSAIAVLQPRVDRALNITNPDAVPVDSRANRRLLAFTYMRLGDALLASGHVTEARDAFAQDVRLSRSLASEAGGRSITAQRDLSISLERMGDILAVEGRIEDAIARYVDSHRIAETLATAHPHDDALRKDLSITQRRLSEWQAELKKRGG